MYINRVNQELIEQAFANPFVTAVLGPRRVGKSSLVKRFIEKNRNQIWVELNLDIREQRQRIEKGELRFLIEEKAAKKLGSEKVMVAIDEAQKCPEVFDQIKVIYDDFKDKNSVKFILTGSGFLYLHRLSAESLAGRVYLYYLREFGLREQTAIFQANITSHISLLQTICDDGIEQATASIDELRPLRPLLEDNLQVQLLWGGLPEVLLLSQEHERIEYLRNYLQTYLEKDVRAIATIADLDLYQHLLEISARQTGSLRDDQKILQGLGCARDTLKKYRGFLEATLVYHELHPFISSPLRRLVKSPKGYLLNNGLISYLTGIYDHAVLVKSGLIGYRFENWFLKELQIWLDREVQKNNIYFWRTSGNVEVDFVVERGDGIFPFEVT